MIMNKYDSHMSDWPHEWRPRSQEGRCDWGTMMQMQSLADSFEGTANMCPKHVYYLVQKVPRLADSRLYYVDWEIDG